MAASPLRFVERASPPTVNKNTTTTSTAFGLGSLPGAFTAMLGRRIRPKADKAKGRLRKMLKTFPKNFSKSDNKAGGRGSPRPDETRESQVVARAMTVPQNAGLRITVTARFELPVDFTSSHTYQTSDSFVASDKICSALVNRIQHCANELITRRDPEAAQPLLLSSAPHVKDARYHLIFQIERSGQPWAQQYFACFQAQTMDAAAARKVIYGTDRIVSLFLQRHDPGFRWELPPIVSGEQVPHTTYKPVIGCTQSLECIPNYSGMPGYTVDISVKTQHRGQPRNWKKSVESCQNSPLTLHAGESLMARVQDTMQRAFEQQEAVFDELHMGCNGLEGTGGCQHYEEGAFELEVKVRNNIGPDFSHLNYHIQTFQILFTQDQTAMFEAFVELLEGNVADLRDEADATIGSLDDLRVQIQHLSCKDWSIPKALAVSLDCSVTECRTTVEAVLERVQTGLKHTLQGHDLSAVVTAHKRGHLVLDTFIQGHGPDTTICSSTNPSSTDAGSRLAAIKMLRERLCQDITAVCKDTCSLQEPERLGNLRASSSSHIIEDNQSKHSTTPPVSICLSQRRVVKKTRTENLRATTPGNPHRAELEGRPNTSPDCHRTTKMASMRVSRPSISAPPSLADLDSVGPTDGVTTPEPIGAFSVGDPLSASPTPLRERAFSKSTRASNMSGTYTEEPSVIHHAAHLGDASYRLLENLAKEQSESPTPAEKPREMSWGQHSSTSNDSATIAVPLHEQQFADLEAILQEDIYAPPKALSELAVVGCEVKQPALDEVDEPREDDTAASVHAISVHPDGSSIKSDASSAPALPSSKTPKMPIKTSTRDDGRDITREFYLASQDFGNPLRIFSSASLAGLPPACTRVHAEGHIPRSRVSSFVGPSAEE